MTIRSRRLAMATRFEILLVGDDQEHLEAVGEAALDEVTRIERLLSRHDPASEVSRINREAAGRPVRVDRELFAILEDCRTWFDRTHGYFDLCATGMTGSPRFGDGVDLDPERMMIRFVDPSARLDFGGYGKGYALDAASRVLDEFGVVSALMHGGTSSVLARGRQEDGSPWRIGLRDPFDCGVGSEVARLDLTDCGVSSSAVFDPGSNWEMIRFAAPEGRPSVDRGETLGPRSAIYPIEPWEGDGRSGTRSDGRHSRAPSWISPISPRVSPWATDDRPSGAASEQRPDRHHESKSDMIDPIDSRSLDRQAACSVIAPSAREAEVLSTGFLAMGIERASSSLKSFPGCRAAWIGRDGVEWLEVGGLP